MIGKEYLIGELNYFIITTNWLEVRIWWL